MRVTTGKQQDEAASETTDNRRKGARMPGRFGLTFSGVDGGQFVMGDGQVMDVSPGGIGVRGNRLLKQGMEVALFIELPDSDDHLCVPEAHVSWVKGRRFGVALRSLKLEDENRLRFFLWQGEQAAV
jgi:hypothetical protein